MLAFPSSASHCSFFDLHSKRLNAQFRSGLADRCFVDLTIGSRLRHMASPLPPFHLAFPVYDIAEARTFYLETLGCQEGRSAETWVGTGNRPARAGRQRH